MPYTRTPSKHHLNDKLSQDPKITWLTKIWFAFNVSRSTLILQSGGFQNQQPEKLLRSMRLNFKDAKIQIKYAGTIICLLSGSKGVTINNNMPRKEPGKVTRPKEASSPREGDILLQQSSPAPPALWPQGPSRYTNLTASKDDLISCKGMTNQSSSVCRPCGS